MIKTILLTIYLLSLLCTVNTTRIFTNFPSSAFEPGEKLQLIWNIDVTRRDEILSISCGKKRETTEDVVLNNDLIVLASKELNAPFTLPAPIPESFQGRLQLTQTNERVTISINPLRASDAGRYFCIYSYYKNDILETKNERTQYTTLKLASASERSGDSNSQVKVIAAVFAVLALVVFVIIVAVFVYKRRTRRNRNIEENDWTKSDLKNPQEKERLKSMISNPEEQKKNGDRNENTVSYAQVSPVQVVSTPSDALNGKKVVYVEDDNLNGFV